MFHDPTLTSRRVMFAAVDSIFTLANLAFALGDFELAVENVFCADTSLIPPTGRGEIGLLDDFLDDSVRRERSFGDCLDKRGAYGASGSRSGDDTAGGTSEELRLTASDFGLADSDIALAS